MHLSFGLSPLLLALAALVAAGLTYWTYRGTVPALSPGRRALLGGLRFLALFLVLALLFEPVLRRVEREERAPVLAVLVDDSQSLALAADTAAADRDADGEAPDPAPLRAALARLPLDATGGEARVFAFDADARPLPGGVWSDSLRFGGARTDIARALDRVRDALGDENLRGVLLVSDGRYNTGRNPLYLAERYPVPIHTLVVGDTTARRDVQVRRVTANEVAYVGREQPVQVGLRSEDLGGERVDVQLLQDGRVLDRTAVTLPEGTAEVTVDFAYTPPTAGFQRYTVAVSRVPGEATYRNNTASFAVRVLERQRRILLVAAAPDPDVGATRALLAEDPDTEVEAYVQKAPGTFYEGTLPSDLSAFDALVLVGYPGAAADAATAERLAAAAGEDLPVLFLMTRGTDLAALERHFGAALPVTPAARRASFVDAAFVPTPVGLRHPILDALGEDGWRRLPPLAYNESRWQAAPDARVLAVNEVRGIALGDPFLVVRSRTGARSAALLGAGTWRWANVPEDLRDVEDRYERLLTNTLQWITTREEDRPVRVEPVEEVFAGGEAVEFTGQVYDESLNPLDDAAVEVVVTAPDGATYPYRMEAVGGGRYVARAGALPEGTYRYRARAERDGAGLGTDEGTFAVGGLTVEYQETRADAALMRALAERSGGTVLAGDGAVLPAALRASGTFTPAIHERTHETDLRRLYGFLAAVVVLLSLEWFFRKRSGLV